MALLYSPPKKTKNVSNLKAEILDLDYQGFGVAKINGKTWFIENALPHEQVECRVLEEKRQYGRATAQQWRTKSPQRVVAAAKGNTFLSKCNAKRSSAHCLVA